jgi:hypothetical protein
MWVIERDFERLPLVDIALGDTLRRRDASAVLDLAHTIKARRIVTTYAGHDDAGKMRVTLQLVQLGLLVWWPLLLVYFWVTKLRENLVDFAQAIQRYIV